MLILVGESEVETGRRLCQLQTEEIAAPGEASPWKALTDAAQGSL